MNRHFSARTFVKFRTNCPFRAASDASLPMASAQFGVSALRLRMPRTLDRDPRRERGSFPSWARARMCGLAIASGSITLPTTRAAPHNGSKQMPMPRDEPGDRTPGGPGDNPHPSVDFCRVRFLAAGGRVIGLFRLVDLGIGQLDDDAIEHARRVGGSGQQNGRRPAGLHAESDRSCFRCSHACFSGRPRLRQPSTHRRPR